jgi:hypothetical protein
MDDLGNGNKRKKSATGRQLWDENFFIYSLLKIEN